MFSCLRIHTLLSFTSAILLWNLSFARPLSDRFERRTSRSYFSRCGRGSSSSLERLSSAVPIKKILASFDISKKTAFFRLESCSSYSLCFITKTNVISRNDFGAPNTILWSKLVKEYQGKAPVPFSEIEHRKFFIRTKLEDSCLHGFYVIGQKDGKLNSRVQSDGARPLSVSILTQAKGTKRARRKKNGRRKPRRNKPKRNRQRKRKFGNRKRSAQGCKTDDEFCVRRCIAWDRGDCTQLQISCNFMCPVKS